MNWIFFFKWTHEIMKEKKTHTTYTHTEQLYIFNEQELRDYSRFFFLYSIVCCSGFSCLRVLVLLIFNWDAFFFFVLFFKCVHVVDFEARFSYYEIPSKISKNLRSDTHLIRVISSILALICVIRRLEVTWKHHSSTENYCLQLKWD